MMAAAPRPDDPDAVDRPKEKLKVNEEESRSESRSESSSKSCPVEKDQPRPLTAGKPHDGPLGGPFSGPPCGPLSRPPSGSPCRPLGGPPSGPLKAQQEDLCASVLLACLFCRPLDCVAASVRGCVQCSCSVCWYLCGCDVSVHHCDPCCGQSAPCCIYWDCPLCELCVQATECLDLAMEISQMLFH